MAGRIPSTMNCRVADRRIARPRLLLATGRSLGRNPKVSRFAEAWCVVVHTQIGELFGPPAVRAYSAGPKPPPLEHLNET
jgi:hypothetical protein